MPLTSPDIVAFLKKNLPFPLDYLPENSYLVGGAVRDFLLRRQRDYLDLDFIIVQDAVKIAKKIANNYQGGFVLLDQERQIARVVLANLTCDFAQQEGNSLSQDLARRDYTINAIACHCFTGEIVDPFQGKTDLENKLIKMVSENNLKEDPLRLLRAYRQASQLDFTIEKNTRLTIQKLAPKLSQVAPERVNSELDYLLLSKQGNFWLKCAYEDGVLSSWLKNIESAKLSYLDKIDQVVKLLGEKWSYFRELDLEIISLAKLSLLVSPQLETAEIELTNLKYSRQEIKAVLTILRGLNLLSNCEDSFSLRKQYFFFLEIKPFFPHFVVVASAYEIKPEVINILINRYLDKNDLVAHPQPLLTGNDLIDQLELKPSPLIGKLLTEITIANIEGKINNTQEALDWAKNYIAVG